LKKSVKFIVAVSCILLGCLLGRQRIEAGVWDNAYTYYTTYGNQAVFRATSQTDGRIYCATKGAVASTGIKYRTIGWKMDVVDTGGSLLQSIYFQLGGAYLVNTNTVQNSTNIYQLYALSLSSVRSRMNATARAAMDRGKCSIVLNACMVVVRNNVPQGSMNDHGVTSGRVYTTYSGIVGAANWALASRTALLSYFNKSVSGLFYTVSVRGGTGIDSVGGGGTYCYGTLVTISASASMGYEFSHWSGSQTVYSGTYSFYVNGNSVWYANARKKSTTVTFYRNSSLGDRTFRKQTFAYGNSGQCFADTGFTRSGYHLMGWSHQSNAGMAQYGVYSPVSSEWIKTYYPTVSLYAVWQTNSYTIRFDGNGALSGSVASITTRYDRTERLPKNGFEKPVDNCTFLGWGLSGEAVASDYPENQNVAVSQLAQKAGVQDQNNATITLYAIWDYAPVMETADLYYSLQDAQSGMISEHELAGRVKVMDREDGEISYGIHDQNLLVLTDYDAEVFLNAQEGTDVEVTYETVDSAGNCVDQTICVHLVETAIWDSSTVVGKIRLIDQDYFMDAAGNAVPESKGGLKSTSRWLCEEDLKNLLWEVLQKANLP
jgi:hypothetical protein